MPSQLHEALLLLFRNRPELAPSLLREAFDDQTKQRLHDASVAELESRVERILSAKTVDELFR